MLQTFDVQLVSVTGGAVLGASRSLRVAILKNDSPSGMFRFVETLYSVSESPDIKGRTAHIQVERVQGTQGECMVHCVCWCISALLVIVYYKQPTFSY